MNIAIASILVFILNIPFGYWRANVRKYSLQWVFAIHIPVPVVVLIRFALGLGYAWYTFPFLIFSFFTGQFIGSKIHDSFLRNHNDEISSCLVMDLIHFRQSE